MYLYVTNAKYIHHSLFTENKSHSGLVLVYNVLFVRYISHDSPTQLDPSSFFSKNVSVSMRKNTSLALIVLVSILSTKYHTEIDLAREAIIHPHEQRD